MGPDNGDNDGAFILSIKELLAFNTEFLMMKNNFTVKEILKKAEEYKDSKPLSRMVMHTLRTGEKIPRVDKLFIFGRILNEDPREFIVPRESKLTHQFLSLSSEKRRDRIRLSLL